MKKAWLEVETDTFGSGIVASEKVADEVEGDLCWVQIISRHAAFSATTASSTFDAISVRAAQRRP